MASYTLICLVCFVVVAVQMVAGDDRHYCQKTYTVWVRKSHTFEFFCGGRWCGWRWCRNRCSDTRWTREVEYRTNNKSCCTGWRGPRCNIPICNPPCLPNYVCYAKDTCFCKNPSRTKENCTIVDLEKCSLENNCYPGSCYYGRCRCASGFEGTNCDTMRDSPLFTKCQLRLLEKSGAAVFTGKCDSTTQYYSNRSDVTDIVLDWETKYTWPSDIPHKPQFVEDAKFGVVATSGSVSLQHAGSASFEKKALCYSPVNKDAPHLTSECKNVRIELQLSYINHQHEIEANMTATTGGFKDVRDTETSGRQYIAGVTSWQTVRVTFDLKAPTHCTETYNCSNAYVIPVDVGRQIDKNAEKKRSVRYSGWEDADSGLEAYSYEVFQLSPDAYGFLAEGTELVAQGKQTMFSKDFPSYTLSHPGMYSVVLTVEDSAGNAALARGLFLWDPKSSVTVTNEPMFVTGASDVRDNVVWLTWRVDSFVVNWQGHFENAFQHTNKLLNRVKPWLDSKGLDDVQGNRTVDEIPNMQGIVNFHFGYDHMTDVIITTPSTWIDVELNKQYELQEQLTDGEFIKVFVKAEDVTGNNATDSLVVGIDSTPPDFRTKSVQRNIPSDDPAMPYSSRIALDVEDKESGIKEIQFVVLDAQLDTVVGNGTVKGKRVSSVGGGRTKRDTASCQQDGTCVCTPHNGCYWRTQEFFVNHCWLVHGTGTFKVAANIYNNAGLPTSTQFNLVNLDGLSGVNVYPKPTSLTVKKSKETTVEISWSYDISCYKIVGAKVTFKSSSSAAAKELIVPASKSSYVIDNLNDNREYTVDIVTLYADGKASEATSLHFNSEQFVGATASPQNEHSASGGGVSLGAIIGLVVVMLLLLVIIAVLALFVVTRLRKKEPILPRNLSDFRQTMRQSMYFGGGESVTRSRNGTTVHFTSNHTLYNTEQGNEYVEQDDGQGNEDELYDYSTNTNQAYDNADYWKIAAERVVLGRRLPGANGRFADIHEATWNGKTVVAKKVKDSSNPDNKILMLAKMKFWVDSKLNHENILHFVGAIPEGPVLFFELCDLGRLKNWLAAQKKVTDEVEDKMITFSEHIARGMKHLHSQQIFHRRLGTRNVLLKSVGSDGIVAKISGFGPLKGDVEGSDVDIMDEKVPVKWMAPEQLDLPPDVIRPYDAKTDIWSFGVMMWEMFSKGDVPYQGITSGGLKTRLDSGYRLERPDYCPEMMYEQVVQQCWNASATSRPTFEVVCKKIEALFIGGASGDDAYYYDRKVDGGYKNIWD